MCAFAKQEIRGDVVTTTPDLELDDLDFWIRPQEDIDEAFRWLRAHDPYRVVQERDIRGEPRGGTFYALTRYADIVEVSRRPEDFSSGQGSNIFDNPPELREVLGSIIAMDDPRHAQLRRVVAQGFTPRMLDRMKANITRATNEIIDAVAERGECDFVTEIAVLLPLRIIDDLLGIPRSEEQFIVNCTNAILGASDPEFVAEQTPRGVARSLFGAAEDLGRLLRELAEARIKDPQDDLISALVTGGKREEILTPSELAAFFNLLVGAGNETTRNAITHGLSLLTRHPDQRQRWTADFDAVAPTAVEEIVRYASPVVHMRRTVTHDGVRVGDLELKQGDKVVMWYGSANRDEDVFDDPDTFDVTRSPNPHVGYGAPGPHFCLGAHLARREILIAFRELFRTLPDISAVGDPEPLRSNFIHGIKHLRAEWTPTRGSSAR
jgi:cytochrome P450